MAMHPDGKYLTILISLTLENFTCQRHSAATKSPG